MIAGPSGASGNAGFNEATVDFRGAKGWTWGGCHFQSEFAINPANGPVDEASATDIPSVWEAIMKLPLAQGSIAAPAYLPNLTTGLATGQTGDVTDRILWQRVSHIPLWGLFVTTIPQLETTVRDVGHGPIQVRAKARCTEREAIFHVQNHVNGFGGSGTQYTLGWDAWFMQAIKANLR